MAKIVKTFNLTCVLDTETGESQIFADARNLGAYELFGLLQMQVISLGEKIKAQSGPLNLSTVQQKELQGDESNNEPR